MYAINCVVFCSKMKNVQKTALQFKIRVQAKT